MANIASNQQINNSNYTLQNQSSYIMDQKRLTEQSAADMLSSEIKKIRLRISDYYRSNVIEPILFKIWKLMVEV